MPRDGTLGTLRQPNPSPLAAQALRGLPPGSPAATAVLQQKAMQTAKAKTTRPSDAMMTPDQMVKRFEADKAAGRVTEYANGPMRDAYVQWSSGTPSVSPKPLPLVSRKAQPISRKPLVQPLRGLGTGWTGGSNR